MTAAPRYPRRAGQTKAFAEAVLEDLREGESVAVFNVSQREADDLIERVGCLIVDANLAIAFEVVKHKAPGAILTTFTRAES